MNKFVLYLIFLTAFRKASILTSRKKNNFIPETNPFQNGNPNDKDKRNLFLTSEWDADEKTWEQTGRMKEVYRKEYQNMLNGFNVRNQLSKVNEQNLEQVHATYGKLVNNIKKAKDFLGDRMENIYNNFIMPGRWFH